MLDALSEVANVNGWDSIFAITNNRERSKIWMQTQPGASIELVENIVSLSVAIR